MRPDLLRMVAEQGLSDAVSFLGQLRHDELLRLYDEGKVDCVVLPTLHEGIPVSLIEAMGYGIPVVSTTVGGIPELLRSDAGLTVPPKDSAALAEALDRLTKDPVLQMRLAEMGRKRVIEEFAVERVVSELAVHFAATRDKAQ